MAHDDGKIVKDIEKSDVILVGISRTSKTPTSMYLANRGYKVSNVPVIPNKSLPDDLFKSAKKTVVVGLVSSQRRGRFAMRFFKAFGELDIAVGLSQSPSPVGLE